MKCVSLKAEQNHKALNIISKTLLSSYRTESHKEYGKLLTPFAYSHMKKELDKVDQAEVLNVEDLNVESKLAKLKQNLRATVAHACFLLQ